MEKGLSPTKGNLIKAKNTLKLSGQGYELLDKKRNILTMEMMSLIDRAELVQSKIDSTFKDAYHALQSANITLGISNVEQLGYTFPEEDSVSIRFRSIMGVDIPMVEFDKRPPEPRYGFSRTSSSLDEAYEKFNQVKTLTAELAEIENAVYRLAMNVLKTKKRANALKNIIIPRYTEIVKYIQEYLEEKERENFSRLKVIKSRNST
ncbi:MAG TPA: V-type ATP synthase subunit D [Clostridia bacterium]|jgi:V/A-type H+-transporting ATPase subunit D|nr:V-type ATP synthase subunit D [Clostridia bacterium]HPQ46976.1 V-type ATP synthase subunit D [Clostridia bacterium]HRX41836.1 V-type ATP synthase subunit D [Clostridia bacterium]